MQFFFSGRLSVSVHRDGTPGDADWARYVDALGRLPPTEEYRFLVYSPQGTRTIQQRAALEEQTRKLRLRTAIVSDSTALLGVGATLERRGALEVKVFATGRLPAAIDYLELSAKERRELLAMLRRGLEGARLSLTTLEAVRL